MESRWYHLETVWELWRAGSSWLVLGDTGHEPSCRAPPTMAVNFTAATYINLMMGWRLINIPLVVDGIACPSPMFVWTNIMGPVDAFSNRGAYIALLFPRKNFNFNTCLWTTPSSSISSTSLVEVRIASIRMWTLNRVLNGGGGGRASP